jgi:uncharacterized protein (DUF433 family)
METIKIIDRGRGPELERIRITVYDLIPYLQAGDSPQEIASVLPISVDEVLALQRYIQAHQDEVMAVHRRIEERLSRGNPAEVEERLRSSPWRARLHARWEEIHANRENGTNGDGNPFRL